VGPLGLIAGSSIPEFCCPQANRGRQETRHAIYSTMEPVRGILFLISLRSQPPWRTIRAFLAAESCPRRQNRPASRIRLIQSKSGRETSAPRMRTCETPHSLRRDRRCQAIVVTMRGPDLCPRSPPAFSTGLGKRCAPATRHRSSRRPSLAYSGPTEEIMDRASSREGGLRGSV